MATCLWLTYGLAAHRASHCAAHHAGHIEFLESVWNFEEIRVLLADFEIAEFGHHPFLVIPFLVEEILLDGNSFLCPPGKSSKFFPIRARCDGLILRDLHPVQCLLAAYRVFICPM